MRKYPYCSQVLQDCMRHHGSLIEIGKLWVSQFILLQCWRKQLHTYSGAYYFLVYVQGNLHDRYGQLVGLYTKLLCTKLEFHMKVRVSFVIVTTHSLPSWVKRSWNSRCFPQHRQIPPNLEVTDEVLERTAGTDINNVWVLKKKKINSLERILFSFFFHYCSFSSTICLCPFLCILKATVLLQVSAHRGGVRLPGCRTEAGRHRWKTKPCSLFSLADFFNNRKLELLFRATACWHCLFMFKNQEPLKAVTVWNFFPASNCNKKKKRLPDFQHPYFLIWANLNSRGNTCN